MITSGLIVDRQEENRDRLHDTEGVGPRGSGRGAAGGDDPGREGRPAQPVLLLRRARRDRRRVAAEAAGEVEDALARGGCGSLLFQTDPAEINRLQRLAVEGSRHGIPALFGFDVIHGLRTILPVPIAMAASWDPETIERGQAVAAREARAVGIHWTFAPMVDIARDPRWGRIVEGAGEDPYLGAAVAAAQVRGFQGEGFGVTGADHRRAQALRRLRRGDRRPRLRRGQPVRLRAVERLLPAVPGRARGRRRQRDDGVHGASTASRPPATAGCSPRCCGSSGVSTASWSATPTRSATSLTHGFAADLADAGARGRRRRGRPRDGHDRPGVRPPARGGGERRGDARRRSTPASGASWRPSCGSACSRTRTSTRTGPGPCWPTRRTARWRGWRRSGRRCCCATRATCCRWTPRALGSVAVVGPLADSKRDTLGPWVLRLRPGRDRHRAGRAAPPARRVDRGPVRARHPPGAAGVPVDVRHVPRQHARPTRRTSTTRPSCSGPSTWPGTATWPSWCSASGSR